MSLAESSVFIRELRRELTKAGRSCQIFIIVPPLPINLSDNSPIANIRFLYWFYGRHDADLNLTEKALDVMALKLRNIPEKRLVFSGFSLWQIQLANKLSKYVKEEPLITPQNCTIPQPLLQTWFQTARQTTAQSLYTFIKGCYNAYQLPVDMFRIKSFLEYAVSEFLRADDQQIIVAPDNKSDEFDFAQYDDEFQEEQKKKHTFHCICIVTSPILAALTNSYLSSKKPMNWIEQLPDFGSVSEVVLAPDPSLDRHKLSNVHDMQHYNQILLEKFKR